MFEAHNIRYFFYIGGNDSQAGELLGWFGTLTAAATLVVIPVTGWLATRGVGVIHDLDFPDEEPLPGPSEPTPDESEPAPGGSEPAGDEAEPAGEEPVEAEPQPAEPAPGADGPQ